MHFLKENRSKISIVMEAIRFPEKERIPGFTSKIEQLFFFGEKFSINITLKFPPPSVF